MWLVAGLGNPGSKYAMNRHNIGFMVVDELARRHSFEGARDKFGGMVTTGVIGREKVSLIKPMEFMNLSGHAVQRASHFWQVPAERVIAIHDEMDIDLSRIKLKRGGGHGGHNGIRSMIDQLGDPGFVRVRCGVGRPGGQKGATAHVLGDFSAAEQTDADLLVQLAADAVEEIVKLGVTPAMNRFNQRDP